MVWAALSGSRELFYAAKPFQHGFAGGVLDHAIQFLRPSAYERQHVDDRFEVVGLLGVRGSNLEPGYEKQTGFRSVLKAKWRGFVKLRICPQAADFRVPMCANP